MIINGYSTAFELGDIVEVGSYFFVLFKEELHDSKEVELLVLVLEPDGAETLDFEISVDFDVVNHFVGLVQAVLLWHLFQHLLVLLQQFHRNVVL